MQPPEPQPDIPAGNPPNARSLTQKLDAMLLKAANLSVKTVKAESLDAVAKSAGLGKNDRRALAAAAKGAQDALDAVSKLTGREIASAFAPDVRGVFKWTSNADAQTLRAAIDAQAVLSEALHKFANRPGVTDDLFETVSEMAMQCDRRQSEIATLSMELADASVAAGYNPALAARLDATLSALLPRQALSMHGNAEILEKLNEQIKPLADRVETFAERPNASLSAAEFMQYAAELKAATATLKLAGVQEISMPAGMSEKAFAERLENIIVRFKRQPAGPAQAERELLKNYLALKGSQAKQAFLAELPNDPQFGLKARSLAVQCLYSRHVGDYATLALANRLRAQDALSLAVTILEMPKDATPEQIRANPVLVALAARAPVAVPDGEQAYIPATSNTQYNKFVYESLVNSPGKLLPAHRNLANRPGWRSACVWARWRCRTIRRSATLSATSGWPASATTVPLPGRRAAARSKTSARATSRPRSRKARSGSWPMN